MSNQGKKEKNSRDRNNKKESQKARSSLSEYAKYSTIGLQMLVIVLLSVYAGLKLDEWVVRIEFPLFTMLGSIFGVAGSVYFAIKDFIKFK